ncbi:response regulator transcription factor [Prosthecobacter sp.]|uniref:response regulator n=1 Tax=Prosthecobacter sp. TaxID=1965333 RepID=UPI0025F0888F|nr:response regulator transcription factor [Prosthecobacter sp.]
MKRLVLVDDHPIMRHGLAQLIRAEDGLEVIGEAGSAREGLEVVGRLKPDLVVIDLTLPDKNGLELVKDIRAAHPATLCLVLSMHDEALYGERALRAGARGYVMKEAAADHLVTAIHKVIGGGLYVSATLNDRMLEQVSGAARSKATGMDSLTDRELEILELVGKGVATKNIAAQLSISARTVEAHRAHIKEKLGITDGAALVRYAVQWVESSAKM